MDARKTAGSASGRGFTLLELLVTITVIALLAGISLPTFSALFSAGAEEQAYNVLAAQLMSARAVAIRSMTYAGVHVQLADHTAPGNSKLENVCFSAVVWDDPNTPDNMLTLAPGFSPQRMPEQIALGRVDGPYVDASGNYANLGGAEGLTGFTTFTVVFSPNGKVATQVEGDNVKFDPASPLFGGAGKLWDYNATGGGAGKPGASVLTIFNIRRFLRSDGSSERASYLNTTGMFLPVNPHTGLLLPRR